MRCFSHSFTRTHHLSREQKNEMNLSECATWEEVARHVQWGVWGNPRVARLSPERPPTAPFSSTDLLLTAGVAPFPDAKWECVAAGGVFTGNWKETPVTPSMAFVLCRRRNVVHRLAEPTKEVARTAPPDAAQPKWTLQQFAVNATKHDFPSQWAVFTTGQVPLHLKQIVHWLQFRSVHLGHTLHIKHAACCIKDNGSVEWVLILKELRRPRVLDERRYTFDSSGKDVSASMSPPFAPWKDDGETEFNGMFWHRRTIVVTAKTIRESPPQTFLPPPSASALHVRLDTKRHVIEYAAFEGVRHGVHTISCGSRASCHTHRSVWIASCGRRFTLSKGGMLFCNETQIASVPRWTKLVGAWRQRHFVRTIPHERWLVVGDGGVCVHIARAFCEEEDDGDGSGSCVPASFRERLFEPCTQWGQSDATVVRDQESKRHLFAVAARFRVMDVHKIGKEVQLSDPVLHQLGLQMVPTLHDPDPCRKETLSEYSATQQKLLSMLCPPRARNTRYQNFQMQPTFQNNPQGDAAKVSVESLQGLVLRILTTGMFFMMNRKISVVRKQQMHNCELARWLAVRAALFCAKPWRAGKWRATTPTRCHCPCRNIQRTCTDRQCPCHTDLRGFNGGSRAGLQCTNHSSTVCPGMHNSTDRVGPNHHCARRVGVHCSNHQSTCATTGTVLDVMGYLPNVDAVLVSERVASDMQILLVTHHHTTRNPKVTIHKLPVFLDIPDSQTCADTKTSKQEQDALLRLVNIYKHWFLVALHLMLPSRPDLLEFHRAAAEYGERFRQMEPCERDSGMKSVMTVFRPTSRAVLHYLVTRSQSMILTPSEHRRSTSKTAKQPRKVKQLQATCAQHQLHKHDKKECKQCFQIQCDECAVPQQICKHIVCPPCLDFVCFREGIDPASVRAAVASKLLLHSCLDQEHRSHAEVCGACYRRMLKLIHHLAGNAVRKRTLPFASRFVTWVCFHDYIKRSFVSHNHPCSLYCSAIDAGTTHCNSCLNSVIALLYANFQLGRFISQLKNHMGFKFLLLLLESLGIRTTAALKPGRTHAPRSKALSHARSITKAFIHYVETLRNATFMERPASCSPCPDLRQPTFEVTLRERALLATRTERDFRFHPATLFDASLDLVDAHTLTIAQRLRTKPFAESITLIHGLARKMGLAHGYRTASPSPGPFFPWMFYVYTLVVQRSIPIQVERHRVLKIRFEPSKPTPVIVWPQNLEGSKPTPLTKDIPDTKFCAEEFPETERQIRVTKINVPHSNGMRGTPGFVWFTSHTTMMSPLSVMDELFLLLPTHLPTFAKALAAPVVITQPKHAMELMKRWNKKHQQPEPEPEISTEISLEDLMLHASIKDIVKRTLRLGDTVKQWFDLATKLWLLFASALVEPHFTSHPRIPLFSLFFVVRVTLCLRHPNRDVTGMWDFMAEHMERIQSWEDEMNETWTTARINAVGEHMRRVLADRRVDHRRSLPFVKATLRDILDNHIPHPRAMKRPSTKTGLAPPNRKLKAATVNRQAKWFNMLYEHSVTLLGVTGGPLSPMGYGRVARVHAAKNQATRMRHWKMHDAWFLSHFPIPPITKQNKGQQTGCVQLAQMLSLFKLAPNSNDPRIPLEDLFPPVVARFDAGIPVPVPPLQVVNAAHTPTTPTTFQSILQDRSIFPLQTDIARKAMVERVKQRRQNKRFRQSSAAFRRAFPPLPPLQERPLGPEFPQDYFDDLWDLITENGT